MLVEAEIASFAMDPNMNTPVIILKEISGYRTLPVPIGPLEASAIAVESLKVTPEKPLTIDLVKQVIKHLGGNLERVIISDMIDQSIQARIQIRAGSGIFLIDCRPCDAIALALRCNASILIEDRVLGMAMGGSKIQSEKEKLRRRIRSIDTVEFGKYFLE